MALIHRLFKTPWLFLIVAAIALAFWGFIYFREEGLFVETPEELEMVAPQAAPERQAVANESAKIILNPDEIIALQEALTKAGYFKRPTSGIFNRSTVRALQRYQHDHNLRVSGGLDAETLKRLDLNFTPKCKMKTKQPISGKTSHDVSN